MNTTTPGETPVFDGSTIPDRLARAGLARKPDDWPASLDRYAADDVRHELAKPPRFSLNRLSAFVSPAAAEVLEDMAVAAHRLTRRRFGSAITLFAPLYLSNYCINHCRYCGFNAGQPHRRRRLSLDEAFREAEIIASEGFRDILLVSGEDRRHITVDYLCSLARRLRKDGLFATVGVEIYIQPEDAYRRLVEAGVDGVTIFQETYQKGPYASWHPAGPKAAFENRLEATAAAGRAGMRRLGLGALLGLEDWRFETLAMGLHADILGKTFWRAKTSFSFPRIRPAESGHHVFSHGVSDAELTRMILALRLCFPDSGITLSTRESPGLRDALIPLGVTQISAGSKTNPGGYGEDGREPSATEQFAVSDERSAGEMAAVLRGMGYDPVWKDWDAGFQGGNA